MVMIWMKVMMSNFFLCNVEQKKKKNITFPCLLVSLLALDGRSLFSFKQERISVVHSFTIALEDLGTILISHDCTDYTSFEKCFQKFSWKVGMRPGVKTVTATVVIGCDFL